MSWIHDPTKEPPSVADQCAARGWEFGYFWRTGANDDPWLYQFNPGLAMHNGRMIYCVRHSNYSFGRQLTRKTRINRTLIGEVDMATMVAGCLFEVPSPDENFEDSRLTSTSMGLHLAGTVYNSLPGPDLAQQTLLRLDEKLNIAKLMRPAFGGNRPEGSRERGNEKNWTWFETEEGQLTCLYHHNPHTLFHYYPESNSVRVFTSSSIPSWEWGELRGGTNPVCWNDQWLTIAHCCTANPTAPWHPNVGNLRRYVAVAVRFRPKPPYEITGYTDPILVGTLRNDCPPIHQPAVFPGGLAVQGDIGIMAFGINDRASAWVKIKLTDLRWKLLP